MRLLALGDHIAAVAGDADVLLGQAVDEIAAGKFKGGNVTVKAERRDGNVLYVVVVDTGVTVPTFIVCL